MFLLRSRVAQAMASNADRLHVSGDIIKDSVHQDMANHTLVFDVTDATGRVTVVYKGTPPQNMDEATKVVAVDANSGDVLGTGSPDFQSREASAGLASQAGGGATAPFWTMVSRLSGAR